MVKKVFKRMCMCFALCSMIWDQPLEITSKCLLSLMAIAMATFWAAILILPCSAVLLILLELSWKEFAWIALAMYGVIWVIELVTGFSWGIEKIDESSITLDGSENEEDQKSRICF